MLSAYRTGFENSSEDSKQLRFKINSNRPKQDPSGDSCMAGYVTCDREMTDAIGSYKDTI